MCILKTRVLTRNRSYVTSSVVLFKYCFSSFNRNYVHFYQVLGILYKFDLKLILLWETRCMTFFLFKTELKREFYTTLIRKHNAFLWISLQLVVRKCCRSELRAQAMQSILPWNQWIALPYEILVIFNTKNI